jgi:hypothetical protein
MSKNVVRRWFDANANFINAYGSFRDECRDYRIDGLFPSQYPPYRYIALRQWRAANVLSFADGSSRTYRDQDLPDLTQSLTPGGMGPAIAAPTPAPLLIPAI